MISFTDRGFPPMVDSSERDGSGGFQPPREQLLAHAAAGSHHYIYIALRFVILSLRKNILSNR